MIKKCLIISGGEYKNTPPKEKYDLIIACDKGYIYAKKMRVKPDIVVGDFDSIHMPSDKLSIIAAPCEKDDTDTALAIKYALHNGYKVIDIICALGKRIDHTIANIVLLKYIAENGSKGKIISDKEELFTISEGVTKIKKRAKSYLSIFSLSDKSIIEYIKGTKYDVRNIILKDSFPLGVSNEFNEPYACIKVKKGILLVGVIKK